MSPRPPDRAETQLVLHHPVHIVREDGSLSPSAFIPFCDLGGDAALLGRRVEGFDLPVCDKFEVTSLEGRRCYRLDTTKHIPRLSSTRQWRELLSKGLTLLLDYNEDRDIHFQSNLKPAEGEGGLVHSIAELQTQHEALVSLDTLCKLSQVCQLVIKFFLSSGLPARCWPLRARGHQGDPGDGLLPRPGPGGQQV